MRKNKDRWSALSMKERAELFKIGIQNGIKNRKTIIDMYNSFGDGGDTNPTTTIKPLSYTDVILKTAQSKSKLNSAETPEEPLPPNTKVIADSKGNEFLVRTEEPLQDTTSNIMEWAPGVGDIYEAGYVLKDVKDRNFKTAALAAGLLVLPGNIRKILDKLNVDLGDIKSMSKLTDNDWNRLQSEAIKSGNEELEKSIRIAHAKVKAQGTKTLDADGNFVRTYRGQYSDDTYKRLGLNPYSDKRTARGTSGYFSTTSPDVAASYVPEGGKKLELYTNFENPKIIDAKGSTGTMIPVTTPFGSKVGMKTDVVVNNAFREGYDGVIIKNVRDDATRNAGTVVDNLADDYVGAPGRTKLLDARTYDDSGRLIPLSERDNFNVLDVRYGLLPIGVGVGLKSITNENTSNTNSNGGKINLFGPGGPKDSKHVEDVVRTTRGSTGRIFTRDFPWVDVVGAKHLFDSWRVMRGNNKKVAPSDDNYTGTAMKGVGVQTDDGLGFASQQDLANVLGYTPTDFVDTYVYGDTPFEELGVFKKETSPERHVVRSKVKKVEDSGKQVNTYQTQRDTLDTDTVAALDSLLNAGLVDLHSRNTTYQESPFNIGDSGIIYDGNNSTIATAYLPNGMPVSKAIDVFDTDPKEWNYKVGPLAKTGLSFIHDNTNPFLMTTPWYYPIKSTDYLSRLYYLFGIDADREYNVRENKGDKNGVIWELSEALEWLDNHPDLTEMPVKTKKD